MQRRAVGRVERGSSPGHPASRGQLVGLEPPQIAIAEPERTSLRKLVGEALLLRRGAGDRHGPALGVVGVDPLQLDDPAHLVDRAMELLLHGDRGRPPVAPFEPTESRSKQAGAPSAVAPARAESDALALQHGDPHPAVSRCEVVGGPQSGQPGTDDGDVDVEIPRQPHALDERLRWHRLLPERCHCRRRCHCRWRRATVAASALEVTPSFVRMRDTWTLAVFSLMNSE